MDYEVNNAKDWLEDGDQESVHPRDADAGDWNVVGKAKNKGKKQAPHPGAVPGKAHQSAIEPARINGQPATKQGHPASSQHDTTQARSGNLVATQIQLPMQAARQPTRATREPAMSPNQTGPSTSGAQSSAQVCQQTSRVTSRPPADRQDPRHRPGGLSSGPRDMTFRRAGEGRPTAARRDRFARVKPTNDQFGKDNERQRKQEQRNRHLIERQAGNEGDDIGNRGVFVLSDQSQTQLDNIRQSLNLIQGRGLFFDIPRDRPIVQVVAPDLHTVHMALSRVRGSILGSISAQQQFQMVLVESPGHGMTFEDTKIRMLSAWDKDARPKAMGLAVPKGKSKMYPILLPVSRDNFDPAEERKRLRRNTLAIQVATARALGRLVWFKGSVTMRIYFGALAFHRYRWDKRVQTQKTEEFLENLRNSGTEAGFYKLAKESNLYNRVTNAQRFLLPFKGGTVSGARPSITGIFVWMNADTADRIYEIRTETIGQDASVAPNVLKRGWMAPNAPGLTKPLSIFLTQVNRGISAALQIHTEAAFVQPKDIPLELTAQKMKLLPCEDYVDAAKRGCLMFDWRPSGCTDFKQRTTWKWRVKAADSYIFELVRYDAYEKTLSVLSKQPIETRWDACVYHEKWDNWFARNISIKRGEKAQWDPAIENFFPNPERDDEDDDEDEYFPGEPGVPPGLSIFMQWVRDFLGALNKKERMDIWRNDIDGDE